MPITKPADRLFLCGGHKNFKQRTEDALTWNAFRTCIKKTFGFVSLNVN
jgi:hypothetical protein